ncbi:hypothetical protein SAMN04488057_112108 [Cyclobacterium lianum]|uniref:Uncharacterized protein n=1 Tax=Cyclobacterium lianum TaxID=388280 RepID=A0A1M7PZZ7_9BACT|nr:hypothetical protein SAMN04488057_112108 [Cyclobacterium lianum]
MEQQELFFNLFPFNWQKQPVVLYLSTEDNGRCTGLYFNLFLNEIMTLSLKIVSKIQSNFLKPYVFWRKQIFKSLKEMLKSSMIPRQTEYRSFHG